MNQRNSLEKWWYCYKCADVTVRVKKTYCPLWAGDWFPQSCLCRFQIEMKSRHNTFVLESQSPEPSGDVQSLRFFWLRVTVIREWWMPIIKDFYISGFLHALPHPIFYLLTHHLSNHRSGVIIFPVLLMKIVRFPLNKIPSQLSRSTKI